MGNVLLFFDHRRGARQMAAFAGTDPERVWQDVFASDLLANYERGALNSEQFHAEFCLRTNTNPTQADLEHALSDIFIPNYELWAVIGALKYSGYQLGVLSNTCAAHWEFVNRHYQGLFNGTFSTIALSYELQSMKPERSIYDQAQQLAGVPTEQIFYCDDIAGHIAGAKAAGWDAVVFENVPQYVRDLRARGIDLNY
jgi:glucose-1-phosphatase